jgi:hypothetical protein
MASLFGMNGATTFTDLDAASTHLGIDVATCRSMVDGIREGLAEYQSLA